MNHPVPDLSLANDPPDSDWFARTNRIPAASVKVTKLFEDLVT